MLLIYKDDKTNANFRLILNQDSFDRFFYGKDRTNKLLSIVWNRGAAQKVFVDEAEYDFPANSILPLMINQSFYFEDPRDLVAWQFNRDFYCIVDHDKEVSCVGFLFYGVTQVMFIQLEEADTRKIDLLLQVFKDEFENTDNVQGAMLRMLLVRLIITLTRLGKQQCFKNGQVEDSKFNLFREFNLLVEMNYRQQHEVQFYAAALNKSPKTLANVFALYDKQTPLQIILERIALEAKRLFCYTDKSSKEIAAELGFDDAAHFSRFFKNQTGNSPSHFKSSLLPTL